LISHNPVGVCSNFILSNLSQRVCFRRRPITIRRHNRVLNSKPIGLYNLRSSFNGGVVVPISGSAAIAHDIAHDIAIAIAHDIAIAFAIAGFVVSFPPVLSVPYPAPDRSRLDPAS